MRVALRRFGFIIIGLLVFGMVVMGMPSGVYAEEASAQSDNVAVLQDGDTSTANVYPDSIEHAQSVENGEGTISTESTDSPASRIYNAIVNHTATVDLNGMGVTVDQIGTVVQSALNTDPILNYSVYSLNYYYTYNPSNNNVLSISFNYNGESKATFDARYSALKSAVDTALQSVDSSMSAEEKALALHDYLILHAAYDTSNPVPNDSYKAYGVLVNGKGVCNSYAEAYNLLLTEEGIPSFKVTSTTMNHAWNMVKLNGSWFHVDVTWDDPLINGQNEDGFISYSNFLLTDAGIGATGHSNWDSSGMTANSDQYANMPRTSNDTQDYYNDGWYTANDQNLTRTDFSGNGASVVASGTHLAGVQSVNGSLFYSQGSTIKALDTTNNASSDAYSLSSSEKGQYYSDSAYIYGLYPAGNGQVGYRYYKFASNGSGSAQSGSWQAGNYASSKKTLTNTQTDSQDTSASVAYRTHVQNVGWQSYVENGDVSGTTGQALRLEGINVKLENANYSGGITYRTHIQNIGWENEWKADDAMSGTSGRALRLEAIQIQLTGEMANHYDVYYRVHCQNIGWMGWAKNGQQSGSAGFAYRLEGIQIVLVAKDGAAPGSTSNYFVSR